MTVKSPRITRIQTVLKRLNIHKKKRERIKIQNHKISEILKFRKSFWILFPNILFLKVSHTDQIMYHKSETQNNIKIILKKNTKP